MADVEPQPAALHGSLSTRPDLSHIWTALRAWWAAQVENVDQQAIIEKVRSESDWCARYGFMVCMSAGIAVLGLILSSPAVVIGAMLLSPLMGPILGIGFSLAIGDAHWLKESSRALAMGSVIAVLFCALIVVVSPLQTVTSEIAARTRPNLFDLLVALFSALAGAYAMIRGRGETIVGVAIATALMPPLAVVGFGLATLNWTVFGGAFALFITNLVTIALSAAVMARLYHFRANLSAKQNWFQVIGIVVAFLALAIPLGFSLWQIAWETRASATISGTIRDQFGRNARISQIDVDYGNDPIGITATVLTPEIQPQAEALAKRTLERQLDRALSISIRQYQVGTGSGDAEAALLAAARNDERQRLTQIRDALANQLAMVAGVEPGQVLVDPAQRRATVRAAVLPEAGLGAYRALEARVAATMPDWRIAMIPPAAALPEVPEALTRPDRPEAAPSGSRRANASEPTPEQLAAAEKKVADALGKAPAIELATWAATRLEAPVGVSGPADAVARVVAALKSKGVHAEAADVSRRDGPVTLFWLPPDAVTGL